jgi:tetratricopeptide (TPR) repeat protein
MSLRQGHKLLVRGNYEGALDKYQKVLARSSQKPPEDEALFYVGLIYASSRYPKRDTKKSMDFFTDILNDWPQSPFVEQAKIWLGVLHENERMNVLLKRTRQQDTKPAETKPLEGKAEDVVEGRESQSRSQRLLAAGDFEGFIGENQRILSLAHPRSPKDEALLTWGLFMPTRKPQKIFEISRFLQAADP